MGPSPTTSGMSNAMKERLIHEASLLSSKQHMASLIIGEASIKPKCIYDRKADAVFGLKDKPESSMANPPIRSPCQESPLLCSAWYDESVQNSVLLLLHEAAKW
ncbi:hypothetical protein HPB49_014548 [Dermacentor silvarum]|uniref:Uncharacterized protein n=1 Tax=Dermacentor silvarum TaxID=543639 RepID=A0ACB8DDX5_DERSI|nr:hypothetical protein HPB49_014548 [Dermacentor silvarum]